jgi:hypothetical protein
VREGRNVVRLGTAAGIFAFFRWGLADFEGSGEHDDEKESLRETLSLCSDPSLELSSILLSSSVESSSDEFPKREANL